MKRLIAIILVCILCMCIFVGCTTNTSVKDYGGEATINLPANTKLVNVDWEEDSLWYITRPMREDETAETYTFQEDSSYGVVEGTVTIIETKE